MEINTLSLENHDFSAKTKVFIVDFDNIGSSRDLIHALAKINMLLLDSNERVRKIICSNFIIKKINFLEFYAVFVI